NIITRPTSLLWRGSVSTNYTLPGGGERGDSYQVSPSISGPLSPTLGLKLGAGYSRQNPDQVDISGGRLGSGGVSDRNATAELTWDPTSSHAFSFESSFGVQEALAPSVPDTAGDLQSGWGASHLQRLSL